ncbi:MAG: PilC/PilY family type IV pilus protein [Methyloglobulus sp.]
MKYFIKNSLNTLIPLMVRRAHHRNQPEYQQCRQVAVFPEIIEGHNRRPHQFIRPNSAKWHLSLIAFGLAFISAVSQAGTVAQGPLFLTSTVKPNVMLMLDNSGSMSANVTFSSTGTPYDPAITYLSSVNCSNNAISNTNVTVNNSSSTSSSVTVPAVTVITYGGSPYTKKSCKNAGGTYNNNKCTISKDTAGTPTTTTATTTPDTNTTKVTTTTTTPVVNVTTVTDEITGTTPFANKATCEAAGGKFSSNKCTITRKSTTTKTTTTTFAATKTTITSPISYGTTIPADFFGKKTGSQTGTKCFTPTLAYTTTLSIPFDVTTDAQRANYLNWFYSNELAKTTTTSTRLQVAQKAANNLVSSLKDDIRLGFSTFNDTDGGYLWEVVDDLKPTKKANIASRINAAKAEAWTPLAETTADIGRYFATGSSNVNLHAGESNQSTKPTNDVLPSSLKNGTAWSGRTAITGEPTFSSNPIQFSCQKSFAVLLTDGLPTQDLEISTNSYLRDYDGDCTLANGSLNTSLCTDYDKKKAYTYPHSTSSDYFDDVTQALYEMDLRPDLRKPTKESSKAKNNLTTYVVGFADDDINPSVPGVNPLPKDAAIQGGGKFFYAGSEAELTGSLTRAFQFIRDQKSSSSSVAANSTQFQTNALLFQALFDSGDWTGNIRTFNLESEDLNGNGDLDQPPAVAVTEDTNGNGVLDNAVIGAVRWEAKDHMPAHTIRNVTTFDPVTANGTDFRWDSLNAAQKAVFNKPTPAGLTEGSKIVDYLRGDRSNEGDGPTEYRPRSTVLGDIINSDPLFIGGEDLGYSNLPEGGTYPAHVAHKKSSLEMLYVGANDGMLHGFQVGINPSTGVEGDEVFAYVPNAAISKELFDYATDRSYVHKYFVDGAPQYSDVFYDSAWHTVLVGSMGSGSTTVVGGAGGTGGRAVFALDVTNPDSFGVTNVLWEFSNRNNADLGYTIPTPSVVRMSSGWAAIVANGYNSANGKAALFILDIKTGAVIGGSPIVADSPAAKDNGLSSPTPVDVDGDNIIDYIYAGDLKGNLWKFDVTSDDPSQWGVAFSGTPLFVAKDSAGVVQPITTKPGVIAATGEDQKTGVMVYIGTGKYFEDGDHSVNVPPFTSTNPAPQTQTFYGIWDKCDNTNVATCTDGVVSGRSVLVEQKITQELEVKPGQSVRLTTSCPIAYGLTAPPAVTGCVGATNRRGWFMDLKLSTKGEGEGEGERVVSAPVVRDNLIIFTTLIPLNVTCEPGGKSWFMELDAGGSPFFGAVIDINNDGKIDGDDLYGLTNIGGIGSPNIIDRPTIVGSSKQGQPEVKLFNTDNTSILRIVECPPGGCKKGPSTGKDGIRRSWRQLY